MRAVNLIPSEQRSGGTVGSRSQGAAFAVLALLAGVAVLVFMYGSAHHQVSSRNDEAAALTNEAQQLQSQASQLASYTSFVAMREQRLQAIASLVGSRFDWAAAMGELSRVLPPSVSLSSLQGTVGATTGTAGAKAPSSVTTTASTSTSTSSTTGAAGGGAVSSATPPGTVPTFTLSGCATSQAVVADTLVRLRLISGVSNVTLLSSTASTSSGGGDGSCAAGDPLFSVQVSFEGLPTPPSSSVSQLESTTSTSSATGGQHPVSNLATGAKR
jgi:Tfp pilus assembly protein PilN